MSKRMLWPEAKVHTPELKQGHYRSFKELVQKGESLRQEQQRVQAYLAKCMPYMLTVLEHRLKNGDPLTVMRPLRYQTSELQKAEEDDGFYRNSQPKPSKFVDVIKTILPGTQLILKAIDPTLQEFIFQDGQGNEHCLNFVERNNIMTQTDIYETVKQYLEGKES